MTPFNHFTLGLVSLNLKLFSSIEEIGNFVGSIIQMENTISFIEENECPKMCRPPEHQDWRFC